MQTAQRNENSYWCHRPIYIDLHYQDEQSIRVTLVLVEETELKRKKAKRKELIKKIKPD